MRMSDRFGRRVDATWNPIRGRMKVSLAVALRAMAGNLRLHSSGSQPDKVTTRRDGRCALLNRQESGVVYGVPK
jgi:hypothetical protein